MPLLPGVQKFVGLGLWNSIPATYFVEGLLFAAGIVVYLRSTAATDRTGRYAFWAFVVFLAVMWVASAASPPPSVTALAIGGMAGWVLIPWPYWIDRHRRILSDPEPPISE